MNTATAAGHFSFCWAELCEDADVAKGFHRFSCHPSVPLEDEPAPEPAPSTDLRRRGGYKGDTFLGPSVVRAILCGFAIAVVLWQVTQLLVEPPEPLVAQLAANSIAAPGEAPERERDSPAPASAGEETPRRHAKSPGNAIVVKLERMVKPLHLVNSKLHFFSAYYGQIQMGGKRFTVMFDTGSGNMILPSTYCHTSTCKQRTRYARGASPSARDLDFQGEYTEAKDRDQLTVVFGTGEVNGVLIEDELCTVVKSDDSAIGSAEPSAALQPGDSSSVAAAADDLSRGGDGGVGSCVRFPFVAATSMSQNPFDSFTFDGVVGLAMTEISHTASFNFVAAVANSFKGSEHARTFAIFLANGDVHEESEIMFGGWDETHMLADDEGTQSVAWQDVRHPELGHWIIPVRAIKVQQSPDEDSELDICTDGTCSAAVDSGTATLAVPTMSFRPLYKKLFHKPAPGLGCRSDYPKIHFELQEFRVTLKPEDYSSMVSGDGPVARENQTAEVIAGNATHCKPLLMVMNLEAPLGPKLFILGEPAMRRYYTIFDAEKARIGFSLAHHEAA